MQKRASNRIDQFMYSRKSFGNKLTCILLFFPIFDSLKQPPSHYYLIQIIKLPIKWKQSFDKINFWQFQQQKLLRVYLNYNQQIMQLQTFFSFSPQKHALFVHPTNSLLVAHQSTDFIAFLTRNNDVVLQNTKTGKSTIKKRFQYQQIYTASSIYSISQHRIADLIFTHQYLVVAQSSQLLLFSLKNGKLKKSLRGHRAQITHVSYCRNRELIASISHDQLLIFNQKTLQREKLLNCSTSSFTDCGFTLSGNVMTTIFADGSIYYWNLQDFSHIETSLAHKSLRMTLDSSSSIAVYNKQKVFLADISKQVVLYQQIDQFWKGGIKSVKFIDGMLAINTQSHFYLAQISLEHQFIIKSIREMGQTDEFNVAQYQSIFVFLKGKQKVITFAKANNSLLQIAKTNERNPLTNAGLVCAGGYSNSEGCNLIHDIQTTNNYIEVQQKIEKINNANYRPLSTAFSMEKLKEFVRKNHSLPDKHRPLAYRYLLKLPINSENYRKLQQKGRHQCAALLDAKYPLQDKNLADALKDIISLLAHYSPVFAEAEFIPSLIFPFVCLFGNDYFLCFEILYRLFTRPLSFLFKEFPVANSSYLQNIRQILSKQDPQLLAHLSNNKISFTKLAWLLLTTLFSACLARENFLSLVDSLFVHIDEPQYIIYLLLGFLTYNRARILSIESEKLINNFLETEQSINLGKLMTIVQNIKKRQANNIRYQFEVTDLNLDSYVPLPKIPLDSLKMYENKRKILTQQLLKRQQQERNRDDMLKQMERMAVAARREAERQAIQREAYSLHCEKQSQDTLTFKPKTSTERIRKLQELIDELNSVIEAEHNKKDTLKNYIPSVTNLHLQSNEELDALQLRLARLLGDIKPQQNNHWLKSQPMAVNKQKISNFDTFKASVNTRLAGELWDLEKNTQINKAQRWQNNMLSSLNN